MYKGILHYKQYYNYEVILLWIPTNIS